MRLREYLLPKGWRRSDENNYSLVISPDDRIAIAVCTGDENTGVPNAMPSNKAHKGSSTMEAIIYNQLELGLPPETSLPSLPARTNCFQKQQVTWILLVHRAADEVRCELSLPSSFGTGQINDWNERILLKSNPIERRPDPDYTTGSSRHKCNGQAQDMNNKTLFNPSRLTPGA